MFCEGLSVIYRPPPISRAFNTFFISPDLRQMSDYVTNTTTGMLKGQSVPITGSQRHDCYILAICDDIQRAVQRGEVTIAVLADFLKAFAQ